MGLIKFLYVIFKVPKWDAEKEGEVLARRLVERYVGKFLTKEDAQELKQKVLRCKY